MARVEPLIELQPGGGQVVVTRFECPNALALLAIRIRHGRLKRDVRQAAPGFIAIRTVIDWRRRTMLSISLWRDLDSIYAMGNVPGHVAAARLPQRLGIATTCGIYSLVGDWKRVMFHSDIATRSPLHPIKNEPISVHPHERGA
jgi:hypothetical protein